MYRGQLLPLDKRRKVECTVHKEIIRVAIDDEAIVEYKGDRSQLWVPPNWEIKDKRCSFVTAWESQFLISEIKLIPKQ